MQSEIGWAKVFLAYLKEAEGDADQIRMKGMGIRWTPALSPHHGSDLVEYFQRLEGRSITPESTAPRRMARAVGTRRP